MPALHDDSDISPDIVKPPVEQIDNALYLEKILHSHMSRERAPALHAIGEPQWPSEEYHRHEDLLLVFTFVHDIIVLIVFRLSERTVVCTLQFGEQAMASE